MKIKKEILILVVIIILLAFYLAQRKTDRTHYTLPALAKVETAKIDKIEIMDSTETLTLNKKDDQWYIAPHDKLADKTKASGMAEALAGLQVTALVSEAASYSRYELDQGGKIVLKAWQGDNLVREMDLGKAASTFQHTFVKLPNDTNVYHAGGHLRPKFEYTADELRDLSVLVVKADQIQEIKVSLGDETATFKRQAPLETEETQAEAADEKEGETEEASVAAPSPESQWINTATEKPVPTAMVSELLQEFNKLECSRYLKNQTVADFQDQPPYFKLVFQGAETETLSLFTPEEEDADDYPGISSQNEDAFALAKWQIENLEKKIKALINPKSEENPAEDAQTKAD